MQHLMECCERCDAVVLSQELLMDGGSRICMACVLEQQKTFIRDLVDRDLPTAHDWNNQCPQPGAREQATHVVLPEATWILIQQILRNATKAPRNA